VAHDTFEDAPKAAEQIVYRNRAVRGFRAARRQANLDILGVTANLRRFRHVSAAGLLRSGSRNRTRPIVAGMLSRRLVAAESDQRVRRGRLVPFAANSRFENADLGAIRGGSGL